MHQTKEDEEIFNHYMQLVPKSIYNVLSASEVLKPGDVVFVGHYDMFMTWDDSWTSTAGHYLIALRPKIAALKYKKELDEYYKQYRPHDVRGKYNDPILDQRQETHGDFSDNAATVCKLIRAMGDGIQDMPEVQNVALSQIALKIARIVNGDNLSDEHWKDIAGYANLVVHWLGTATALITPASGSVKACDDGERDTLKSGDRC